MGVASLGWSIIVDDDMAPGGRRIERLGVHRFEAGVADPGKMGFGGEEASAKPRRDARQMRRQLWRRKLRREKTLRRLQQLGFLPDAPAGDTVNTPPNPEALHAYFNALDQRIAADRFADASHEDHLKLPYLLRAAAVSEKLKPHELGRVLYHLAQRRGFLSNRKTDREDDKQETEFKKDMADLADRVQEHDPPVLGAYLASLNPDEAQLRGQRTSRQMYLDEFEAIWAEQIKHHPAMLTDQAKRSLHRAIFYQRPLKSQRHLIGKCSLTGDIRAPLGLRQVQRFRMLCALNNLEIIDPDGLSRPLTDEERAKVLELQETIGDVTWAKLKQKKVLGLPKDATFNLAAQEKKLIGHRTDAKMRQALGNHFDTLDDVVRDKLVTELRTYRDAGPLAKRLQAAYGLTAEQAEALSNVKLEDDRASHSIRAIKTLLPSLERGLKYGTARKEAYPGSFEGNLEAEDLLPPVLEWLKSDGRASITNGAVLRGLTEMRKVVNAIVRKYGKPKAIRLEIARDLKNSRSKRQEISNENQERRKQRDLAAEQCAKDYGITDPRRSDIEKVLLLWECRGRCPYTGKTIEPKRDLFGENPAFQVEHIWPLSSSMDDSFVNKTLCHIDENARKGGRAPVDCYDPETLTKIQDRIKDFNTDFRTKSAKLRRFSEPVPTDDEFKMRHLNDTRYLAKESRRYLERLYGAEDQGQRVFVVTGGLTAMLRGLWGLNRLVGGPANEKERIDHRHHALDALVVALTKQSHTQKLNTAAARAESIHARRGFIDVAPPWDGFLDDARAAVEAIVVSHRINRKLRGKLHQESLYSPPVHQSRRIRRELHQLKVTEIDKIVSKRDREAVKQALKDAGQSNPAKAFADWKNLPILTDQRGRQTRMKKVRIAVSVNPTQIGDGPTERHVKLGSNHHTTLSRDSTGKWIETTVSLFEAMRRKTAGEPVIQPPDGTELIYSLMKNDHLLIDDADHAGVWRVDKLSQGDIELVLHSDARVEAERNKEKSRFRLRSSKSWSTLQPRKVFVNYLGEIEDAGG
jgi:CRISPR-associated endonuclease Csn1